MISVDELTSSAQFMVAQETLHRNAIAAIRDLSADVLRPILLKWALAGFPDDYIVWKVILGPPSVCVDGVSRTFHEYVDYLCAAPDTLASFVSTLQFGLTGMTLSVSYDINTINVHVRKV